MTHDQAYQAMENGEKVTHQYYSDDEYAFINNDGNIETEDGCIHGGRFDKFWDKYQKWNIGWEIYKN